MILKDSQISIIIILIKVNSDELDQLIQNSRKS
jgi:uncharacterized membrane protein YhfC